MSDLYFSRDFIKVLRKNMQLSPHAIRLLNNPVHAYNCTGNDCVEETNKERAKETPSDAQD